MMGFDTGHKDSWSGSPFLIGSKVSWIDSEGYPCDGEIVVKDGCKIGVDYNSRSAVLSVIEEDAESSYTVKEWTAF